MLCRGNDYCFSISVLQSSLQSYPHVSHTVRMKYVDVWMCGCMFACLMSVCVQWSFVFAAFCCILDCSFVRGWTLLSCYTTEEIEDPRKTLRIYQDTKGIVVKMLITMLTAMYMIVRVVESVRQLE